MGIFRAVFRNSLKTRCIYKVAKWKIEFCTPKNIINDWEKIFYIFLCPITITFDLADELYER